MARNAEQREHARLYMQQWRARTRATRVGKPAARKSTQFSKLHVKKYINAGEVSIKQPTRLNHSSPPIEAQSTGHVNGNDDDISLIAVREDVQSSSAQTAHGSQVPRSVSFKMHLSNQMGTTQSQSRAHLHNNQRNIDTSILSIPSERGGAQTFGLVDPPTAMQQDSRSEQQRDEFTNLSAQVRSQNRRLEALEQRTEDIQNMVQDIQGAVEDTQKLIEDIRSAVEDTQNTVEGIHVSLNEILQVMRGG